MVGAARVGPAHQARTGDGRRRAEGDALRRAAARGESLREPGRAGQLLHPPRDHRCHHRPAERPSRERTETGRKHGGAAPRGGDLPLAGGYRRPAAHLLDGQAVPPGRRGARRAGLRLASAKPHARQWPPGRRYRRLDRGGRRRGAQRPGRRAGARPVAAADARGHGAHGALSRGPHRPRGQCRLCPQSGRIAGHRHCRHHGRDGGACRCAHRKFAALLHRRHAAADAPVRRGAQPHVARRIHHRHGECWSTTPSW